MPEEPSQTTFLPDEQFFQIVAGTPLVSIDLVVLHGGMILLGKRLNRPAQDYWFVPGGRILKNECFTDAFQRLVIAELGLRLHFKDALHLGVYEHLYSDSVFGSELSTHYIAIGLQIELSMPIDELPRDQHSTFTWWPIHRALASPNVHSYTKDYLYSLIERGD